MSEVDDSLEVTREQPAVQTADLQTTAQVPVTTPTTNLDPLFGDEPEEWPSKGPAKGIRLTWPVAALAVLLVASVGIWAGGYLQRHSSASTGSASASSFRSALSRLGSGGSSGSAFSQLGGGSSSGSTSGTVTDIIGDTLYVTTANGNLVAVNVGPTSTVNRDQKSSLSALQPGDTVTVQGTKEANGSINAGSVSATQAGVSGGFGGLGSFFSGSGAGG
ncbi:MAG TPA: hypothetical protein VEJ87_15805 [Acidimicrobiales bacterium]|nr:hypothetical protein [Acidimicrobiales bacterium]